MTPPFYTINDQRTMHYGLYVLYTTNIGIMAQHTLDELAIYRETKQVEMVHGKMSYTQNLSVRLL